MSTLNDVDVILPMKTCQEIEVHLSKELAQVSVTQVDNKLVLTFRAVGKSWREELPWKESFREEDFYPIHRKVQSCEAFFNAH